jgi:nucleotide-binding universal stress UspA family protein
MNTATHSQNRSARDLPDAPRVVCGIDASRADEAAVAAACRLAGARGHVALVCVTTSMGVGATAQATIAPARATGAIERAMRQAREAGVRSSAHLVRSPHASDALLQAAADGDVLVVGTHGQSRAGGIALGGVATNALHRATVPVLVARPGHAPLQGRILFASDGSQGSDAACALVCGIAARHELPITLFHVDGPDDESVRHALARQTVELAEATGREPTVVAGHGDPADAIVDAAAAEDPSLLVVGSHGRTGLRALGSVSERVAHHAPCSVLVVRPPRS